MEFKSYPRNKPSVKMGTYLIFSRWHSQAIQVTWQGDGFYDPHGVKVQDVIAFAEIPKKDGVKISD